MKRAQFRSMTESNFHRPKTNKTSGKNMSKLMDENAQRVKQREDERKREEQYPGIYRLTHRETAARQLLGLRHRPELRKRRRPVAILHGFARVFAHRLAEPRIGDKPLGGAGEIVHIEALRHKTS